MYYRKSVKTWHTLKVGAILPSQVLFLSGPYGSILIPLLIGIQGERNDCQELKEDTTEDVAQHCFVI